MARLELNEIVLTATGGAVVGASVQVNLRAGGAATIYAEESGGTTKTNPLTTDAAGRIDGWVDDGAYNLAVTPPVGSGLLPYTQAWDLISKAYVDSTSGGDSAGDRARANHTGTQVAATVSDFNAAVRTSRLDQMAAPSADVAMNSRKLTGVLDPTVAQDAATKASVDIYFPVTTANITDLSVTTAKLAAGAVTPKKAMTVAHVSAVTSYTFSGLDGAAAYGYEFVAQGSIAAASVARVVRILPNASTGSYRSIVHRSMESEGVTSTHDHYIDTTDGIPIAYVYVEATAGSPTLSLRGTIQTRTAGLKVVESTASTHMGSAGATRQGSSQCCGAWIDTSTAVTSLVFDFAVNFTGFITLRNLAEV